MKTIDLVYFDAGGGHRAAAQALHDLARRQRRPWRMRRVNLVQVLDPQATFRRITGFEPEDYYNLRLRRGWTLGLAQELKLLQAMIRLGHGAMVRSLCRHWQRSQPDLVVSLVPNFNRALLEALRQACPGVPCATVMTDLADHPPHFWIEPGQDQTLVCGSDRAVAQALAAGLPAERVLATSGMILRPAFYEPPRGDRDALRRALGLDPHSPAGIVMFGGHGSVQMLRIAKLLPEVPLIFVCGHNAALLAELKALRRPAPHAAAGFVQDVAGLMRAADFFIGKPGPGSLSEAVHLGLPVITFDNAWTMPQERYNVQWIRELGLGMAVPSVRALHAAVSELLARLPEYRACVCALDNRAVFEVLDNLQRLLDEAATAGAPAASLHAG
jgi:processive 1,2-diacylglycerol beta-glucosyltransferase